MYIVAIELGIHLMEVFVKTLGTASSLQRRSFVQSLCGHKLPGHRDCSKCHAYVECGNQLSYTKSQVLTLLNPRKQSPIILCLVPCHSS
jgi:hypothetical protein